MAGAADLALSMQMKDEGKGEPRFAFRRAFPANQGLEDLLDVPLKIRSLRFHSPRLCRIAVFLKVTWLAYL